MQTLIRSACLLLILAASGLQLAAQQFVGPEQLYVHFDKAFYLAGEDLWFTVYFTNPQYRQSEIVHVELYDPRGGLIREQMLKVENNRAHGDFALPPSLSEGYYHFRAYTHWNLNFTPLLTFEQDIAVYEFSGATAADPTRPEEVAAPASLQQEHIRITTDRQVYEPRDLIGVSISTEGGLPLGGMASVSVMDLRYVPYDSLSHITDEAHAFRPELFRRNTGPQQPAQTHIYKSFLLRNPVTKKPVKSTFIAGYVRQTKQRIIAQTDNGEVRVRFDAFYDSSVVQLFDASPFVVEYSPIVSVLSEPQLLPRPTLKSGLPPKTPVVRQYIESYKRRFHLNNLFGSLTNMRASLPEVVQAQLTPTYTYEVDDFIEFESTFRFIKESVSAFKIRKYPQYIPPSRQRSEADATNAVLQNLPRPQYYFKLFVPHLKVKEKATRRNPLLIVNDYLTYDADAILRMDIKNLKRIEVFSDVKTLPEQFGPIGNFGVIRFETRDGTTSPEIVNTPNNLKIMGFYLPREFRLPPHRGFAKGVSREPNLRPMMYWNPAVSLQPGSPTRLNFSANDVPGLYLLRLQGVLQDGRRVYGEQLIRVEVRR
ncbi:MAG: hypothetical protein D6730_06970 [Bacteroidetes bacterium]|nr:MAG: hypothetical protein D6730_06970 [Bacteroidota bacterium]